ncbi:MAG TPA: BREX system ATP-binding domain-containing protein [Longimicrobiales bacterium]|nr:BREX system ATP-binding domain-containing protein [Longimicrobiales bacterium]
MGADAALVPQQGLGLTLPAAPLVGRRDDLAALIPALDAAAGGAGSTLVLVGEGGVGKTRLAHVIAEEARRRGFRVAAGRAYPVETGVPYALFADAFSTVVRDPATAAIALAGRDAGAELAFVLPSLGEPRARAIGGEDAAEFKTRLLWVMSEFVRNLAARQPLLLLDDVHWADHASLELLHFLARQIEQSAVLILCTYNEVEGRQRTELRPLEQALLARGVARTHRVTPFTRAETEELLQRSFDIDDAVSGQFAEMLFAWTRGNAFFVRETLQSLVDSGRLHRRADGQWLGWELAELELPGTVREAINARIERLGADARAVADVGAVIGTRFDHGLLGAAARLEEAALLTALDELRSAQVIEEADALDEVRYDFTHPLLRQVLYAGLGTARARALHERIADALEARYGAAADAHADELAFHFARAGKGAAVAKAARYLFAAGRSALARFADREAVGYLRLALEHHAADVGMSRAAVMSELARAHQRLGEADAAIALLQACLADSDTDHVAVQRRLGQVCYWSGRHADALAHFSLATELAHEQGRAGDEARSRLATGVSLQELGRAAEAKEQIDRARDIAEAEGDTAVLARVHRALLLLHSWTGPPDAAREHGALAARLAREAGDTGTEFFAEWGLAVLEGLTGHTQEMARHIAVIEQIAETQRSPLLRLWTAELSIELATARGEWERGIGIGEHAIGLARSLHQVTLLPRLLVWTALIYLGRGDLERARALIDEAWSCSGADDADTGVTDVHSVLPAHIGRAAYFLTTRDFAEAIRTCERGLAIADRTGYAFWAMHRLLPILAEAHCHLWDVEGALVVEQRIRHEAERLGHRVGLAWADSCRALVVWLQGDPSGAARLIRDAAESLESIPMLPDAARLRRQLAGRLADIGDRDGALLELRRVHEAFARMGAESELAKARGMFREIGAKPPTRAAGTDAEELTAREIEIARMVAQRKSNKAIGKALDISPRTVSTHLSNIFRKVAVSSRGELVDYVRQHL